MHRSQVRNPRPPKVRRNRNISDDTDERTRRNEEIGRLVESGQYHISAIDLGRRMMAYYATREQ